ncbi:hypothetical protein [Kitasatospora sp. NA04385]|uniref:hypothetical protein n=1 Tax=Kitasatospora sp. NA04385 TaxID=2742135 RepID=UPI0020CB442F|nr:hypothetical protein [Kitasatospora sp. NA04385]
MPVGELADRIGELPADSEVVVHCRGAYCALAHDAVRLLRARGRRALRLNDGMLEWRLAELPVDAVWLTPRRSGGVRRPRRPRRSIPRRAAGFRIAAGPGPPPVRARVVDRGGNRGSCGRGAA